MDLTTYITRNSAILFEPSFGIPVKVEIRQERHTSVVSFCKIHFDTGLSKNIMIKSYDDFRDTRLVSLKNEFNFSRKNSQIFNSTDIGIPNYIHLDEEEELVVIDFVENSCTVEKTLFTKHKIFDSISLDKIFFNSGKWLSLFHSVNTISENTILNLSSEIKNKWTEVFDNQMEIKNDLSSLIDSAAEVKYPLKLTLLHKEFGPGNILHVGNKVYGIDFGSSEAGCNLDDIAYFIISTLVLNKFPKHLFYKRIRYTSNVISSFCSGYFCTSKMDIDILRSPIFTFYLYKNLIRRISSQLRKTDQYPRIIRHFIKPFIYFIFRRTRNDILVNLVKADTN